MWVKICGTTSIRDAHLAVSAGADAVGFVFAPSKRRVDASQAAAIISAMPNAMEKTGVFSVADAGEIASFVREAGLTSAQMHFPYDAAVVASLRATLGEGVKLLQVITCPVESLDEMTLRQEVASSIADPNIWAILLDASTKGVSGGTGRSFDWRRVADTLDDIWPERHSGTGTKLILAGGLRQENVREAIASLRPFGVDVVSGVEAVPRTKDEDRVRAFIQAAKY